MEYYTLEELKKLIRVNKVKGYSTHPKEKVYDVLKEKDLLPPPKEDVDPRKLVMRGIRYKKTPVVLTDLTTGAEHLFPSICQASRFIGHSPRVITYFNGKQFKGYGIKISSNKT